MGIVSNIYHAFRAYFDATEKDKWKKAAPEAWDIVTSVMKMQMERDKNG
jgi:hypothetical protein